MFPPTLLADLIGGPVLVLAGGMAALILLAAVVIIETPVLILMRWQPLLASLRDVVIVNFVSMAVGLVIADVLFPFDLTTMIVFSWLLSIVVEGGVLMLLRRESAQRSFLASLAMNTASYLVVALLILVFQVPG